MAIIIQHWGRAEQLKDILPDIAEALQSKVYRMIQISDKCPHLALQPAFTNSAVRDLGSSFPRGDFTRGDGRQAADCNVNVSLIYGDYFDYFYVEAIAKLMSWKNRFLNELF